MYKVMKDNKIIAVLETNTVVGLNYDTIEQDTEHNIDDYSEYNGEYLLKSEIPNTEIQIRVREIRDNALEQTDKYMIVDFPISDEERYQMKLYRQYLRDYTKLNNWWESLPDSFADWRANIEKVDKILKESTKPDAEEIEPEK